MWVFYAMLLCVISAVFSSFYFAFISAFPLENANAINAATEAVSNAT
tara:strand:- start:2719 stop:2859 length:141 start_codon:yes stop_codon:yes gene_type:complete